MPLQTIEERVTELEKKVSRILGEERPDDKSEPWWKRHSGAFKDNPLYDEAMRKGAEYRRSQPNAPIRPRNSQIDLRAGHRPHFAGSSQGSGRPPN